MAGCVAVVAASAVPAVAGAQYQAPPPDPGFAYIFDGSATGRTPRSTSGCSRAARSTRRVPSSEAARARPRSNTVEGAIQVNASPFGGYWYPVKPFGDAVLRLQYTVQNTPEATRNGGVMIRSPEIRYSCPDANGQPSQCATTKTCSRLSRPATTTTSAALRCRCAAATTPAGSTTYSWAGAPGPFPPASNSVDPPHTYTGPYCARPGLANQINWNSDTGLRQSQRQRQQPAALDAGHVRP